MKISFVSKKLSLLAVVCAAVLTASAAHPQGKGSAKAKGKQTVETHGKQGREAGELPFGLQQYGDKNGELPSGLQKKKDDDGALARGLEEGGKKQKPLVKAKK